MTLCICKVVGCISCFLGSQGGQKVDLDDYLFYLDETLERVHFSFYSTLDAVKTKGGTARKDQDITKFCSSNTLNPDVRVIVPEIRRMTLQGCNIVFTGVVPTNVSLEKSKPWRTAISLGSRVTSEIIPRTPNDGGFATTHVVAARHGTKKAFQASRNPDIHLVNPYWLWCASERWEKPEEDIFPIPTLDEKNGKKSPVSSRQGTPLLSNNLDRKSKRQISPLAQDFEMEGGYDPEKYVPKNFLKDQIALTKFTKQELDAMDKEVEELMQSASDDDDDSELDCDEEVKKTMKDFQIDPMSCKRKSTDGNPAKKKTKTNDSTLEKDSIEVIDLAENSDSSSSGSSDDDNDDGGKEDGSSDSGSSSSDDDADSSSEEDSMANMLERRISESSS